MKVEILDIKGKKTGKKIDLSDAVFNMEPNDHAIYLDVKQYLANQRQGTHKTKERGEVRGGGKKPFRQKGTGRARQGTSRSPLMPGGGTIFGPRPRDYSFKVNHQVKVLARKSALTYKAKENKILVLEDFQMEKPKTKEFAAILTNLKLQNDKVIFFMPEKSENVYLSGRNLPKVEMRKANDLNTYDVMHANSIVMTESSAKIVNELLGK